MKLASAWVVWTFLAIGALGWALFVVLESFDAKKDAAAWIQAVGSVAAIVAAVIISSADRRSNKEHIRARELVVIRAVEEICLEARHAVASLDAGLRTFYRPVTPDAPSDIRECLTYVEEMQRDLVAIDLMSMPNTDMVESVIQIRSLTKLARDSALIGYDPEEAINVREFSPLENLLVMMDVQLLLIRNSAQQV
jgi:CheY-like chemotaxis protein